MVLKPVNSFAIRAVAFDGSTLTVEFHTGHIDDHPGVPCSIFQGQMQASSKGAFHSHYIRGKYQ
jgi:hypothetical protein